MMIKYSHQAKIIINNLKSFNEDDFKQWLINRNIHVGDSIITEYILEKEINNGNIK